MSFLDLMQLCMWCFQDQGNIILLRKRAPAMHKNLQIVVTVRGLPLSQKTIEHSLRGNYMANCGSRPMTNQVSALPDSGLSGNLGMTELGDG